MQQHARPTLRTKLLFKATVTAQVAFGAAADARDLPDDLRAAAAVGGLPRFLVSDSRPVAALAALAGIVLVARGLRRRRPALSGLLLAVVAAAAAALAAADAARTLSLVSRAARYAVGPKTSTGASGAEFRQNFGNTRAPRGAPRGCVATALVLPQVTGVQLALLFATSVLCGTPLLLCAGLVLNALYQLHGVDAEGEMY